MSQAKELASRLDIPELAVEILLGLGYDEATIEDVVKRGLESGKVKSSEYYRLESLVKDLLN